jgi:hypothetical protein
MKKACVDFGYRYEYLHGEVHINAFYNYGTELTGQDKNPSEFIAYCNADVVFHEGWLENLLELWNEKDNKNRYLSMHPYSFSPDMEGICYRASSDPEDKVVECDHPLMHVSVLRRSTEFIFDKQFPFWETDCDYWMTLRSMGALAGIAYNSRVDHLGGKIQAHRGERFSGDETAHLAEVQRQTAAKLAAKNNFEAKWRPYL